MRLTSLFVVAFLLAFALSARADSLSTRAGQRGRITQIDKGVFQLGADSTLILGYSQEADDSELMGNVVGSALFRYFFKKNVGISGRVGGVYRKSGDARDLGLVGSVWANLFLRLGEGMFFTPGVGFGFRSTQRDVPIGSDTVARSSVLGGIAATELMLAVFLNRRFCLTAGPEFVLTVGNTDPEQGEGTSFLSIDGGFKVGVAYSY
jgi:hypothetical protein